MTKQLCEYCGKGRDFFEDEQKFYSHACRNVANALKRHEVSCYLKTYTTNVNKTNINQTPSAKNEMLFKCRHCLGQFGTKFALKRHIRTHLKPSTLAFQCVQCEK